MAKGEIAHDEQFLLWRQCFQKSSAAIVSKCVCRWQRVKYHVMLSLQPHTVKIFGKYKDFVYPFCFQRQFKDFANNADLGSTAHNEVLTLQNLAVKELKEP